MKTKDILIGLALVFGLVAYFNMDYLLGMRRENARSASNSGQHDANYDAFESYLDSLEVQMLR